MNYTFRYYKLTEINIIDSINWYKNQKLGLQKRFSAQIKSNIKNILENPFLFQIKHTKIRVSYLKIFPFGIQYYINEEKNEIVIVAILHTKRNQNVVIDRIKED